MPIEKAKDATLRDMFAAAAIADAAQVRHVGDRDCTEDCAHLADWAYKLADAMMARRAIP